MRFFTRALAHTADQAAGIAMCIWTVGTTYIIGKAIEADMKNIQEYHIHGETAPKKCVLGFGSFYTPKRAASYGEEATISNGPK